MLGQAMSDRALAGGGTPLTAAGQFPVAGRRTIELRAHYPAHPKRTAVAELRRWKPAGHAMSLTEACRR
jgi:hypothetical protein